MRYLKRYSAQYQTLEVEVDVSDVDEAKTISDKMDVFAKEELEKMIKVKEGLESPNVAQVKVERPTYNNTSDYKKQYNNNKGYSNGPSEKQLKILVDNFEKTKSFGESLGLNLNSPDDCKHLNKKDAGKIIEKIFNS